MEGAFVCLRGRKKEVEEGKVGLEDRHGKRKTKFPETNWKRNKSESVSWNINCTWQRWSVTC